MARIVLSPLVSKISGSIGSLVFKKIDNGYSVNLKPRRASLSCLLDKNVLSLVHSISSKWLTITQIERDKYIAAAQLFSFVNKFGNQSFLSGRLLFIKLNNINYHRNKQLIDIDTVTSVVPLVPLASVNMLKNDEIKIKLTALVPNSSLLVQVRFVKNQLIKPVFDRSKIISVINSGQVLTTNIYQEVIDHLPFLQSGDYVHIYITELNNYGFKNIPKFYLIKIL